MKSFFTLLVLSFSIIGFSQPANDSCISAIHISLSADGNGSIFGTTAGATPSNGNNAFYDGCLSTIAPVRDVWYTFSTTTLTDFDFSIKRCNTSGAPTFGLYRGWCNTNGLLLLPVDCVNDMYNNGTAEKRLYDLDPNTLFFVRVANKDTTDLSFEISFTGLGHSNVYSFRPPTMTDTRCQSYLRCALGNSVATILYNTPVDTFTRIISPSANHSFVKLEFRNFLIDTSSNTKLEIFSDSVASPSNLVTTLSGDVGNTNIIINTTGPVMIRLVIDSIAKHAKFDLDWTCSSSLPSQNYHLVNATICEGGSYLGYTVSGTYLDTFSSVIQGCDSLQQLNLIVIPKVRDTLVTNICQGDNFEGYTTTGFYSDTLTGSNGCDSIRSINLSVIPSIKDTLSIGICQGDSIEGYSSTGFYIDTLVAYNGCDSIRSLVLTVFDTIIPMITAINDSVLQSSSGVFYQWYFNGNPILNATQALHQPLKSGVYTVEILDSNGCLIVSNGYLFTLSSNKEQEMSVYKISIIPNPNNGQFRLEVEDLPIGEWDFQIFSITGQLMQRETRTILQANGNIPIELQDVNEGLYLWRMVNKDGVTVVRKFIVGR